MNTSKNNNQTGNGQKQVDLVMQTSLHLLPLIMNNIPQAVFWKDRDLVYLGCNKAFADDAGFSSPEDVVGKTDFDMPWKDQAELYRADNRRVIETGEPKLNYEEPQTMPNGSTNWVRTSLIPVREDGQVMAVLGMYEDITERKQAEEAIQESERRYQTIFNSSPVMFWLKDTKNNMTQINEAAAAFENVKPEDLNGRSAYDVYPREQAEAFYQDDLQVIRSGKPKLGIIEKHTSPGTGKTTWLETGKVPVRDENGMVTGVLAFAVDITERQQTEKSLQESEERFRRFTEATIEGLVFHEQGKIIDANPAALAMYGLSDNSEFIGRNLLEFIVPESHKLVLQQMQLETVLPYEILCFRADGSTFPVETSTRIYNLGGRTIRASAIRDITARKQAEQKLQENQQLLQLVMDNIPQSVFWKSKDLTYLGVNQAFAEDAGFTSPQELVGRDDFDMPWKEQAELYRADDQRVLEGGEPKLNYEEPQTGPTGQVTWLRTSKIPMRDANGNIFAVLGMYEDITESKRLQQQIQKAFERRGYQVQVSNEISQEVAAAPELNELFELVVTLTKERLGYYHTQLLRYSTAQDAVVLISGYGETGHKMLADGHKMPMGSGLIGTAAESGQTVLRSTLADDPDWHPNPLLPETKGEIAVPIKWQDTVLGVLDVQSDRAGALTEDDRLLLEGLCGQIAIAMHNAELVETVRQNEARLAEALKTARLANWEYDVEKDLFTFNDQFYSIFHTTAEKVGGYKLTSARYAELFVHPDDMEVVGIEIGKALNSTERVYNTSIDHRILYADGGVGYITVKLTVERDENGKITRYYGANQDITERKQAEEALRINEARLAEALKIARLGNWEYDFENDLFHFTDEFYSIFRTTAEKVGGYKISSADYAKHFVHPDDAPLVGTEIQKVLDAKDRLFTTQLEHRIIFADGETGYISVHINVERDENGKITRWYGANQDITERKQAEEALRRSEQEMADRLEEINRLYQNLSHEGWKAYRETADLPSGFVFDQTGTRPVEAASLPEEHFAQVPMKVLGGEVVGNLAVADDPQHPISNDDLDFLQQVSDQVALALEGARLTAQTQSALAQTEALYETSTQVARATTIDEVLRTIVEMTSLRNFDYGSVSLFTGPWNPTNPPSAVLAASWDPKHMFQMPVGTVFSMVDSPFTALPSDRSIYIADVETATELDEKLLAAFRQYGRSLAFYPLRAGDQYLGSITMMSATATNLAGDDLRQIETLISQAAMVVENRRQFERAQKQAERESMLNVISQKIQSATTVEAVLQIAARELGHALGAPMTIAQLSMKDKK